MTIKRNWLRKQVELGRVIGKCDYSITDDYAFDNAINFGKTTWLPVRISNPRFETTTLPNGNEMSHVADDDWQAGYLNLRDYEFKSKSGLAYRDGEEISLHVHSNLSYTFRLIDRVCPERPAAAGGLQPAGD